MKPLPAARIAVTLLLTCGGASALRAEGRTRQCLAPEETREAIAENALVRPVIALRAASQRFNGEALGAKLCRWGAEFVYEITLLQKDGRVVHAFVNALNGDIQGARNAR